LDLSVDAAYNAVPDLDLLSASADRGINGVQTLSDARDTKRGSFLVLD
jgi:hypothetical protein